MNATDTYTWSRPTASWLRRRAEDRQAEWEAAGYTAHITRRGRRGADTSRPAYEPRPVEPGSRRHIATHVRAAYEALADIEAGNPARTIDVHGRRCGCLACDPPARMLGAAA